MGIKKRILALAAAGALGALSAVPAMAFENEFHGLYNLKYYLSNYESGAGGPILQANNGKIGSPNAADATADHLRMNNYFEQRARIFYSAKASDDLKLVTGFEIDSVWGDKAQGSITATNSNATAATTTAAFRNSGGALEADAVNLETKWVYLDFRIPSTPTRVTAGIQPFKDQLKGIFLDADIAGVLTRTKLGDATVSAGYFRAYDQSYFSTGTQITGVSQGANVRGNTNLDIGAVELKYNLSKDTSIGAVYYLYADSRPFYAQGANDTSPVLLDNAMMIHTLGVTGETKLGPVALSGFAAYQGGVIRNALINGQRTGNSAYLNAFALNGAAKVALGPGTLKTAALFTSGNDTNASNHKSSHYTGWVGTSQSPNSNWAKTTGTSSYNEGGMMLLNRNNLDKNTSTDYAMIYNTSNGDSPLDGQGMYLLTVGYDAAITPKFYVNTNAGFAWAAKSNNLKPNDQKTGTPNQCNYMGTEVNIETGYKMYDNLTAKLQGAYVILGSYYKNSITGARDPENPYTIRTVLSYAF